MTTKPTSAKIAVQLPEVPQPEDMNNYIFFHSLGHGRHLAAHFGKPETTMVFSEVFISPRVDSDQSEMLAPDLLIAFDVDPRALNRDLGYVIDHQGKPPDFVLEIASRKTGVRDITVKRDRYAEMGIPEYWRFDNTGGEYVGAALAGDRLVNGVYQPMPIEQLDDETWQGHSDILNLDLRWDHGQLGWYYPNTGRHITTFDDETARADSERARAESERVRAESERVRADNAEARAEDAEARNRQLEEEIRRLRNS